MWHIIFFIKFHAKFEFVVHAYFIIAFLNRKDFIVYSNCSIKKWIHFPHLYFGTYAAQNSFWALFSQVSLQISVSDMSKTWNVHLHKHTSSNFRYSEIKENGTFQIKTMRKLMTSFCSYLVVLCPCHVSCLKHLYFKSYGGGGAEFASPPLPALNSPKKA